MIKWEVQVHLSLFVFFHKNMKHINGVLLMNSAKYNLLRDNYNYCIKSSIARY